MTTEEKMKICSEKIAALLREYNCDLVAIPQIVDGKIATVIQLVSKD